MTTKPKLPDPKLDWAIPLKAVYLIALFESCKLVAYKCPAGVWTIGWGETHGVYEGERWTQEFADQTFCTEVRRYATAVQRMCKVTPSENELGALTSLAYNIGIGGLQKSSVLAAHNRGDHAAAARAFAAWSKYRDPKTKQLVVSRGLARRRAEEASLYLTPDDVAVHADVPAAPAPQAVAAPATPVTHPLTISSAVATGAGLLGSLSDLSTQASSVGTTAQTVATNAQATVSSVQTAASTAHSVVTTVAGFVGLSPTLCVCVALTLAGVGLFAYVRKLHAEGRI